MNAEIVLQLSPQEEELAKKREELANLQAELADRELYLADLRAELAAFDGRYLREVGVLRFLLRRGLASLEPRAGRRPRPRHLPSGRGDGRRRPLERRSWCSASWVARGVRPFRQALARRAGPSCRAGSRLAAGRRCAVCRRGDTGVGVTPGRSVGRPRARVGGTMIAGAAVD